jgi:hypothetical protein
MIQAIVFDQTKLPGQVDTGREATPGCRSERSFTTFILKTPCLSHCHVFGKASLDFFREKLVRKRLPVPFERRGK